METALYYIVCQLEAYSKYFIHIFIIFIATYIILSHLSLE